MVKVLGCILGLWYFKPNFYVSCIYYLAILNYLKQPSDSKNRAVKLLLNKLSLRLSINYRYLIFSILITFKKKC